MVLVAVVVVGLGAGLVGLYVAQRAAQSEQANQQQLEADAAREAEELVAKEAEEAKIAEQQQQAEEEPDPTPTPTPSPNTQPSPAPAPAPSPEPKQEPSEPVTPITMSDCNGQRFTVYVANKNGTKGSYKSPGWWEPATSYAYKQQISVVCQINGNYSPDYVIGNDDYLKSSDLSKTPL